jgi:hypothetical protein
MGEEIRPAIGDCVAVGPLRGRTLQNQGADFFN